MAQIDNDQNTDISSATLVRELVERGIAQVRAGEHEAGLSAFEDAERQATDAGLAALAAGAVINQGWALWLAGDRERSLAAYEDGAARARDAGDDARLALALGNLGIAYTGARRHADADAVYAEYVGYLADDIDEQVDARLNWGVALEGLGRGDDALAQLDEAQRIAEVKGLNLAAARVHLARGGMLERAGETDEAFELYWKAFDVASDAEDADLVGTSTMTLGSAYIRSQDYPKAADCFGEAARAFGYLEDDARLGAALYQHGRALQWAGLLAEALDVWREAEPIFRELGDHGALGECLLQQALAVSDQHSNLSPDLQFTEAAAAFRTAGMIDRLAEIHLVHAQWCWERSLDSAARTHVREALDAVATSPDVTVESRARAFHAQLLADDGDIERAETELVAAEAVAQKANDAEGITGVLARRAYVMARAGESFEDVRAQLLDAGDHAREAGHEAQGRVAADAIATEIEERCGRAYTNLLGAEDEKNVPVPGPGDIADV